MAWDWRWFLDNWERRKRGRSWRLGQASIMGRRRYCYLKTVSLIVVVRVGVVSFGIVLILLLGSLNWHWERRHDRSVGKKILRSGCIVRVLFGWRL